jgi:hypothetical protein
MQEDGTRVSRKLGRWRTAVRATRRENAPRTGSGLGLTPSRNSRRRITATFRRLKPPMRPQVLHLPPPHRQPSPSLETKGSQPYRSGPGPNLLSRKVGGACPWGGALGGVELHASRGSGHLRTGRTALVWGREEMRAIEALRRSAYQGAPEFDVLKPAAYEWTQNDDHGHVLAVWDDNASALATMRGTVVAGRDEAEALLECTVPLDIALFPALLLERGATCPDLSCAGLNSLMRYHFIEATIRCDLCSIIGAVFEGAPRLRVLTALGYVFTVPESMWDENLVPRTSLLIAALARTQMSTACVLLQDLLGDVQRRFPWYGPRLGL